MPLGKLAVARVSNHLRHVALSPERARVRDYGDTKMTTTMSGSRFQRSGYRVKMNRRRPQSKYSVEYKNTEEAELKCEDEGQEEGEITITRTR